MFTGFASENTPAIQVWDFFRPFAGVVAIRSVSLADDCAPIQVFRTGAINFPIRVYLPTAPIEGKQITIVNQQYGSTSQTVQLHSSDLNGLGTSTSVFTLGSGDFLVLVYSKQNISNGPFAGLLETGWISLNKSSPTAGNNYAAAVAGNNNAASAQYSVTIGGVGNTASGVTAAVVSGQSNTASGQGAVVLGSDTSSVAGTTCAIVGSSNSSVGAISTNSVVIGGTNGSISGSYSVAVGGQFQNISSSGSGSFACNTSSILAGNSVVLGGSYGGNRFIQGHAAIPASANPIAFSVGVSQGGFLVLGAQTTDALPKLLTSASYGGFGFDFNQLSLQVSNPTAYYFKGTVVGYVSNGAARSWTFDGLMRSGSPSGFVGTPTIASAFADAGASAWTVTLSFDTSNRALRVEVTGSSATTIRWVCKLETTEVTY